MRRITLLLLGLLLLGAAPYVRAQAADEQALLRQLRHGNTAEKTEAAQQLGEYNDSAVVIALLAALRDDNPLLRAQAAASLGACGDARALQPLLAASKDEYIIVATQAVSALGQLHAPAAQPALLALLRDGHSPLRVLAATALGRCGGTDPRVGDALLAAYHETDLPLRQAALGALGARKDQHVVSLLSAALSDPASALRYTALQLLPDLPDKVALPFYRVALQDSEVENRRLTVSQLAAMSAPDVFELLLQALRDPAVAVRRAAIPALGQSKDTRVIAPLAACIVAVADGDDDGAHLNAYIAAALQRFHSSLPVKQLVARLQGAAPALRAALINALGAQWSSAAIAPLQAALHDPEPSIRASAVSGLEHFPSPAVIPGLLSALKDENALVHGHAVAAIAALAPNLLDVEELRPAFPLLEKCLKDPDIAVRRNAVSALGALHDADALPVLLAMMDDPDETMRTNILVALGTLRDPRAGPTLLAQLSEHNIGYPIAELGQAAIPALLAALQQTENPVLRRNALNELITIRDPRAIGPLLSVLQQAKDAELRLEACQAVRLYRVPRVNALLAHYLQDPDPRMRKAIAEMLTSSDQKHTVDLLLPLLHDPDHDVQSTAIRGLASANDPRALRALLPLLHDPHDAIRSEVARYVFFRHRQDCFSQFIDALQGKDDILRREALSAVNSQFGGGRFQRGQYTRMMTVVVALVHDADIEGRQVAVQSLRGCDDARVIPLLINSFKHDPSPDVRESAADALASLGDDRAVEVMLTALKDRNSRTRLAARMAVGPLGDTRAIPVLQALRATADPLERDALDSTLKRFQNPVPSDPRSMLSALNGEALSFNMEYSAARPALAQEWQQKLSQPVIDAALAILAHEDDARQLEGAITAIGLRKERRAVPALLDCFWRVNEPPLAGTRWLVLEALAQMADPRATPLLLAVLRSTQWQDEDSSYKRAEIARMLGTLDDPRVLAPLQEAMAHDACPPVRLAAAAVLARRGDAAAMSMLLQSARDVVDSLNYFVFEALAGSGCVEAIDPLYKLLDSDDISMRYQAMKDLPLLLNSSTDRRVYAQVAPLLLLAAQQASSLEERLDLLAPLTARRDARAIAPLSALLADYPNSKTARAVALLREIGGTGVLAPLRAALHAPTISVREAAAEALGALGDHAAAPALRVLVQTDTTRVRVKAIEALGQLKERQAVALLRAVSREPGTRVHDAARKALRQMGASGGVL